MIATDLVYRDIREHLAQHRPERGGALYGPKDYPIVTHFEYDFDAQTSAVSYAPSQRLIANVPRVERESGLRFKGIVHSHPRGVIRPSTGDERTVQTFFSENPHISAIALPIVQETTQCDDDAEKPFMHWYRAERRSNRSASNMGYTADRLPAVAIVDEPLHVVPLWSHVRRLIDRFKAHQVNLVCAKKVQHLEMSGSLLVGLLCTSSGEHEFMYFIGMGYPAVGPVVLYQEEGITRSLVVSWDGMGEVDTYVDRIATRLCEKWVTTTN
ncbi:Mov34/MPN/PAD-1 family protein [Paraburkholderia sp. MM6662-R1]|uniref:Mov34/MPN/PAD-1 family protein n=1 Tax=Paraburkholderia sp. MM6662-R1 TaxID=2991066 RepID=UPI003D1A5C11